MGGNGVGPDLSDDGRKAGDVPRHRVLFLNPAVFWGPGMQVHGQLMKHLDAARYDVFLATNTRGDIGTAPGELDRVTVRRYSLGRTFQGARGPTGILRTLAANALVPMSILRLRRLIRKERIDIVHCGSGSRTLLTGWLCVVRTRAALVVHAHEDPIPPDRVRRLVTTRLLRRADAVIAVSRSMADRAVQAGVERRKVWPVLNVVDLARFVPNGSGAAVREMYGISPKTPLVVMVGRVIPEKGVADLVEAMVRVREKKPDARALIVGWSPNIFPGGRSYRDHLRAVCAERGLGQTVVFANPRPDIEKVYPAADVVVAPSRFREPFGLVIVEAMACGKGVIGTRTGGIPEVLTPDAGVLVPPADHAALADAIIELLDDPERRAALGREARRRAEALFYERRLAEDVERVYRHVLDDRPQRRTTSHDLG